jgi:hypothetical protein
MIGCILIRLTALEHAELNKFTSENIRVNNFFSFLFLKYFLNNFHCFSSITAAILNDGIVRPIGILENIRSRIMNRILM